MDAKNYLMWFPLALTSDITTIGKKGAGGVLPTLRRQFNDVSRSQVMQMGGEDSFSTYKVRYDSDNQVWTVAVKTFVSWRIILTAKTTTSNPTTAAWKVGHQDDVTLTVAAMIRLPPACSVSISCTSPVGDEKLLQVMGEYEATDQYQHGRVVYKNVDRELFLSVRLKYGCGYWVVDWGWGSPILHSQTAPSLCPADPQAAGMRWRG